MVFLSTVDIRVIDGDARTGFTPLLLAAEPELFFDAAWSRR